VLGAIRACARHMREITTGIKRLTLLRPEEFVAAAKELPALWR
jgi:hypothetical protein